jgi:tRNA-dihydrouridine synthase
MSISTKIPAGSLLFAPMEGVTDGAYRNVIEKLYPEWGRFYTDFLRIPGESSYPVAKIREHLGHDVALSNARKAKTGFQILASIRSKLDPALEGISSLGVDHLDLNVGCPSKRVNGHGGGAYLLNDRPSLTSLVRQVRSQFKGHFTVKMRIGYHNDHQFEDTLKLLQDEGVEAITLHARTRDQLYQGRADWRYIARAVETVKIPVIGNGDVWTLHDVGRIFEETGCHAAMMGRGAMKTPWMATLFEENKGRLHMVSEEALLFERQNHLAIYFDALCKELKRQGRADGVILRRFKGLSHHIFDDYAQGDKLRGEFLRSNSLDEFIHRLDELDNRSAQLSI